MKNAPCRCRLRVTHDDIRFLREKVVDLRTRMEWLYNGQDSMSRSLHDISTQVSRLSPPAPGPIAVNPLPEQIRHSLARQLAQHVLQTVETWEVQHEPNRHAPAGAEEKRHYRRGGQANRLSTLGHSSFPGRSR